LLPVSEKDAIYIRKTVRWPLPALRRTVRFKSGPEIMKDKMLPELNPLELRCLSLAARGRTREDITRETDIAHDRIEEAFNTAMEKLRAGNVAEAIFRAARMNLIS